MYNGQKKEPCSKKVQKKKKYICVAGERKHVGRSPLPEKEVNRKLRMAERLMEKKVEETLVDVILEQAIENSLTISNVRKITNEVIKYLENNAVLRMKMEHHMGINVLFSNKS